MIPMAKELIERGNGPDFDGHQVNFEELSNRQKMYIPYEKRAMELCACGEKNL